MANQYKAIIITEDKDFGDLVFHYGFSGFSVILLRYSKKDREQIFTNCKNFISKLGSQKKNIFASISISKVRVRKIP